MAVYSLADLIIHVENRYDFLKNQCSQYEYGGSAPADFTIRVTDEDFCRERLASAGVEYSPGYLESVCAYRKIALNLPMYDAMLLHASVIDCDGRGIGFLARSGVGKTTHVKLWLDLFPGRARILNGDKPVIRLINGKPYVSGTPWRGKEGFGYPGLASLSGIAFLERSKENSADAEKTESALIKFATQAHIPRSNSTRSAKALSLFDKILRSVPLVRLRCNMDISAAEIAYSAFNKLKENN
jgi:hypothetical protein